MSTPQDDIFSGPTLDSKWSFLERAGSPDLGYSFTANPGNLTIHVKPESRTNQVSDITRLIQDTIHDNYVVEAGITASGIASVGHKSGILIVENNTTFILFVKSQEVAGSRLRVYSAAGGAPALIDDVVFTDDTNIILRVVKYAGNFKFYYRRGEDASFTQTPTTVSAAAYGYGAGTNRFVGLGAVAGDAGALTFDYLADYFNFRRLMDVVTNSYTKLHVTNQIQTNGYIFLHIYDYFPVNDLEVRQHFEIPANTLLWTTPTNPGHLRTVVIRKAGSYPRSITDGTVVTIIGNKSIVAGVIPIGPINGTNTHFTLPDIPNPSSSQWIAVYSDGIRIDADQYAVTGNALDFVVGSPNIPLTSLVVDYVTQPFVDPIIWGEIPSGPVDGINNSFILSQAPANSDANMVGVFSDGIKVAPDQYTILGNLLTFNIFSPNIPVNGLVVDYKYDHDTSDIVMGERPAGVIDGSNPSFGIAIEPTPAAASSLAVFSDGIRLDVTDYTLVGTILTITSALNIPWSDLRVDYHFVSNLRNVYLDYVPSAITRWYYGAFVVYSNKVANPSLDATMPVFSNLYKNVGSRFSKKFEGYVWWALYSISRLIQYLMDSDIAEAWAQFNINTATGYFLDVWGRIFGTRRFPSEEDRVYSSRVISRVIMPRTVSRTIVNEVLKIPNVVSCEIIDAANVGMFIGHSFIGFDAPTNMETQSDFITFLAQDNPFFFTVRVVIRRGASLDQIVKAVSDNKAGGTQFVVEIPEVLP